MNRSLSVSGDKQVPLDLAVLLQPRSLGLTLIFSPRSRPVWRNGVVWLSMDEWYPATCSLVPGAGVSLFVSRCLRVLNPEICSAPTRSSSCWWTWIWPRF